MTNKHCFDPPGHQPHHERQDLFQRSRATAFYHGRTALVTLLCVLLLQACASTEVSPARETHSLWKISSPHNSLYLLGTIHVLSADEQLPEVMMRAYEGSDILVMEVSPVEADPIAIQQYMAALGSFPPEDSLKNYIPPEDFDLLVEALSVIGVDEYGTERLKPWLAALAVGEIQYADAGMTAQFGVESRLTDLAEQDNKTIEGLETYEYQISLMAGFPMDVQTKALSIGLRDIDQVEDHIEILVDAWRKGDIETIDRFGTESFREVPEMEKVLVTDRNLNWLPRIEAILAGSGKYLVAVGAAHVSGNAGLLHLLAQKGYTIEQL